MVSPTGNPSTPEVEVKGLQLLGQPSCMKGPVSERERMRSEQGLPCLSFQEPEGCLLGSHVGLVVPEDGSQASEDDGVRRRKDPLTVQGSCHGEAEFFLP